MSTRDYSNKIIINIIDNNIFSKKEERNLYHKLLQKKLSSIQYNHLLTALCYDNDNFRKNFHKVLLSILQKFGISEKLKYLENIYYTYGELSFIKSFLFTHKFTCEECNFIDNKLKSIIGDINFDLLEKAIITKNQRLIIILEHILNQYKITNLTSLLIEILHKSDQFHFKDKLIYILEM